MKLFLISQNENEGYDVYDSAVVAAQDEAAARLIHPSSWISGDLLVDSWDDHDWASGPEQVEVRLIGTAVRGTKTGVLLASYRAG